MLGEVQGARRWSMNASFGVVHLAMAFRARPRFSVTGSAAGRISRLPYVDCTPRRRLHAAHPLPALAGASQGSSALKMGGPRRFLRKGSFGSFGKTREHSARWPQSQRSTDYRLGAGQGAGHGLVASSGRHVQARGAGEDARTMQCAPWTRSSMPSNVHLSKAPRQSRP